MYVRDYESTEALIRVTTEDHAEYNVEVARYNENYTTQPFKKVGSFITNELETQSMANFIGQKFNLSNVYDLNDFYKED